MGSIDEHIVFPPLVSDIISFLAHYLFISLTSQTIIRILSGEFAARRAISSRGTVWRET